MRAGRLGPLGLGLAVAALVGFPLVELLRASIAGPPGTSAGAAWGAIAGAPVVAAMLHTVLTSLLATAVATLLGAGFALAVERSDLPGRRWLSALWLAPLVIPPYVGGLSFLEAYGGAGVSEQWARVSFGWITGPVGVTLLLAIQGYPLAYLLVRAVLASQRSVELEQAARSAGAGPWRVLREVTVPLLRPSLVGAALLVFVASASDFGVPAILGIPAGFSTITTTIYADLSFASGANAIGAATALSTLLGVLTLGLLVLVGRLVGGADPLALDVGAPSARPGRPLVALGRGRVPAALGSWLFFVLVTVMPVAALFLEAVGNGFQLSAWPGHWTAASFSAALHGDALRALARSVLLAAAAAAAVALGGAVVAYVQRRHGRAVRAVAAVLALPFALPGSVVAIAVLLAWQRYLYGSLLIILIAYLARFAVIGVRSADAGLAALGDELVAAGRAAGARPARVLRDVVLPSLAPSLWASFGLVFLLAIHELTMSSLLYGPATATFAVTVLDAEQAGELALTAALALVVTAITIVGGLVVYLLRRRVLAARAGADEAVGRPSAVAVAS